MQGKISKWLAAALLVPLLVATGCGGSDKKTASGPSCEDVAAPVPKQANEKKPTLKLSPKKTYTATVETSCGSFAIKLDAKQAPRTGGSFVTLSKSGFYDGLGFHRVEKGFVIQGGDPAGDGTGGPGYTITEKPPSDLVYNKGTVAMAKTNNEPPGTSGSQFFVNTADSSLPPDYALLGEVTKGQDVIAEIDSHGTPPNPTTGQSPPDQPIVIKKVTITES